MTQPPRLVRRLIARALPADVREDIAGDLGELFHRRAATHGAARARVWYVAEAARVAGLLLWERARFRRGSSDSWQAAWRS